MKRIFVAAVLAALALPAHADADAADEHWFGDGLAWYEHPCGLSAFAKYGHDDRPQVRRAYEITRRDPSQCAKLFP
jgi:opacity protein-like surface antigen